MEESNNKSNNGVSNNAIYILQKRISVLEDKVEKININNAKREEKEKIMFDMLTNITKVVNNMSEQINDLKLNLAVNDTKTNQNEQFRIDWNWKTISAIGAICLILIQMLIDKLN